jgi:pimeloyl-ACP methyl ester carboxylesterase
MPIVALKFFESSRGEIAYEKRGMGDPVLLVHGFYPGASHEEFRHNITALARQFTVYAVDLLGFGESDMPRMTYTVQVYQHLLRELIVEQIGSAVGLIASGGGCGPAVSLAVYEDQLVSKLVLIDAPTDSSAVQYSETVMSKVQQFLLGTLSMGVGLYDTLSSTPELRRFLHSRYAHARHVTKELVQEIHERASRPHAMYAFISQMTGQLAIDLPLWLRSVRCATLLIWGKDVPVTPEKFLSPAAWSRGKRIEIIPDAAHWPHDEQARKVNQLVIDFLTQATP